MAKNQHKQWLETKIIRKIVSKFTVNHLPKIDGEPTYDRIKHWLQLLHVKVATLVAILGGGCHGHIGMIMQPTLYGTLSNISCITPIDPGPLPTF